MVYHPRMDGEIQSLLFRVPKDEESTEAARRMMDDFRAFCLARAKQTHVDLQQAILRRRLRELLAFAEHEGRLP